MSHGVRAPADWLSWSPQSITGSRSPSHPCPTVLALPSMGKKGGTSPGSSWEMIAVDMCHHSSPGIPGSLGTARGKALKGQADPGAGMHVLPGQSW